MKQCDVCFKWKELEEFRVEIDKKNGKSWRSDTCKSCEDSGNDEDMNCTKHKTKSGE